MVDIFSVQEVSTKPGQSHTLHRSPGPGRQSGQRRDKIECHRSHHACPTSGLPALTAFL
jgi:hypothetical protein